MIIAGSYSDNVSSTLLLQELLSKWSIRACVQSWYKGLWKFDEDEQDRSKRHQTGQDQTDNSELVTKEGWYL